MINAYPDKSSRVGDHSPYRLLHDQIDSYFTSILEKNSLYDIFLIDLDGNIVYSNQKEGDFGRNLKNVGDHLSDTGLNKVFAAACNEKAGVVRYADFAPYAASKGQPAAFAATPIFSSGKCIGVFAIQLADKPITEIINSRHDGEFTVGECYILGRDLKYRSNDYHFGTAAADEKVDMASIHGKISREIKGEPTNNEDRAIHAYQEFKEGGINAEAIEQSFKYRSNVGILSLDGRSQLGQLVKSGITTQGVATDVAFNHGEPVINAWRPFECGNGDLNWVLNCELSLEDAELAAKSLQLKLLEILAGVIVASSLIGVYLSKATSRPILANASAARDFSSGNRRARTNVDRNDELGDLAKDMNAAFEAAFKAENAAADIAAKANSSLEGSATAFMTCDAKGIIDYLNPSAIKLLRDNDDLFRKEIRGYDFTKIIGSNVDIYHKNPDKQQRMLKDVASMPITSYLSIGHKTLRIVATARKDTAGNVVGNTIEWLDITQQLADEKKAASLNSIVEAVDTNLMICDLDRNILYLNPSIQKLMREYAPKFRELFKGFDPDKLVGRSIDEFHVNSAKQANILGNPRNLPYKTEMNAAGLEFGVVAMPLFDAQGKYIGSGVQWIDNNARARYRNEVTGVIEAAKNGNLSHRGNVAAMDAIYKPMLAGINEVIDAVVAPIAEIREKLAKVSEGDLTAYVTGQYKGDHEMLKNSLNGTLDKLNEILMQVREASTQMGQGASQVSSTSQMISQGATEQAASLEEITASMNEINSQTKGNAESAGRANQLAQGAKDDAEGGSRNMGRMVQAMSDIDESAQKISKIIKVIDEIAFQTNLLALNAAVEAARAGVHGKGFAVVAEEVRNLAARSANAAKETTELIEGSIKKVNAGSNVAQLTSESLTKIVDGISKVTNLVGEIAAASNEQALGIGQVNQGLVQLDQVTQQNTANAEESAAAAVELSEQGAQLQELIGRFKLQAKTFAGAGGMSGISPDLMDALRAAMVQQGMQMPSHSSSKAIANHSQARPVQKSLFGGHTPPASKNHNDIIPLD